MADAQAQSIIRRVEQRKTDRSIWESHWQEIHDVIIPLVAHFNRTNVRGEKAHNKILDSSGEQAGEMLAGALLGLLVSPDRQWMSLKATNEDLNGNDRVAIWLDDSTKRMLKVFNSPRSNFYLSQHEKYLELVNLGTGAQFIADRPGIGPKFMGRTLSEIYLSENADGDVDQVFRWYKLAARQAVQHFGRAAGEKVNKAAGTQKRELDEFEFIHAVMPRQTRDITRLDPRNMEFASITVNVSEKCTVRESGFMEMPYITPRWSKRAGESYGRGPGSKALSDVKMLQRTMKVTIRGNEKLIDPALQVADDGVSSPINMQPSAINYVRFDLLRQREGAIRPINTGARPDVGDDFMEGIRLRIDNAYFKPLLQLSRDPRMTASQFLGLQQEALQVLSPFLGRLQSEDLGPIIERTFAVMLRRGMLMDPPPELEGEELEVEYLSPVAKAQKLEEARGVAQTMEILTPLIQAQADILDNIDGDLTFREVADTLSWPRDTIRAMEVVDQMRAARAEVSEQQAEQENIVNLAQAAGRAAPALELIQGGLDEESAA